MKATKWDGIGPKSECLLRIIWKDSGDAEWMHFEWRDADASGYDDGEGEFSHNPDEYFNDASSVTIRQSSDGWMGFSKYFDQVDGADFTVTHWAEIPEIPE